MLANGSPGFGCVAGGGRSLQSGGRRSGPPTPEAAMVNLTEVVGAFGKFELFTLIPTFPKPGFGKLLAVSMAKPKGATGDR